MTYVIQFQIDLETQPKTQNVFKRLVHSMPQSY